MYAPFIPERSVLDFHSPLYEVIECPKLVSGLEDLYVGV